MPNESNEVIWKPGGGCAPITGDYIEIKQRMKHLEESFTVLSNWVRQIVNEGQVRPMSKQQQEIEEFSLL